MLVGFVLMIIAFVITSRVAKKFTNIFVLIIVVVVAVLICLTLALAYIFQFTPAEFRESSFKMIIGMGFWFSLFGAIYGAYKGRQIGLKKKELPRSDV